MRRGAYGDTLRSQESGWTGASTVLVSARAHCARSSYRGFMYTSRDDDGTTTVEHSGASGPQSSWSAMSGSARWMVFALTLGLAATAIFWVDDVGLRSVLIALSPLAAAASVIDANTQRIPTRLAMACGGVALSCCVVLAIVEATSAPLVAGLASGAAVATLFLALWRFTGLGLGDVRLSTALAPIAGVLGWQTVVAFVVLTYLLAVPFALWAVARRHRDVPFGPAIVGGLYLTVALAPLL